jgi:hypothetical protein
MIYLTALCLVVLVALVVWQFYAWERERHLFAEERQQWVAERRDLNNRIQAPQAAPFMDDGTIAVADLKGPAYVPFDDDEAYWAAHEERALTRASETDGD